MEPFIADGKYSDAQILNRMLNTNAEGVVDWLNENDIFILFWTKRGDSIPQRKPIAQDLLRN